MKEKYCWSWLEKTGDKRPKETHLRGDRAFIDAVRKDGKPLVSADDGFRVLEVVEAVKTSFEKGRI